MAIEVPTDITEQAAALLKGPADASNPVAPVMVAESNVAVPEVQPIAGPEPQAAMPTLGDIGVETDPFKLALDATDAKLGKMLQDQSDATRAGQTTDQKSGDLVASGLLGVGNAVIETKNFLGELIGQQPPTYAQQSELERNIIMGQKELNRRSGWNAFIGGTAQFVTGMIGVGKVMGVVKLGALAEKGGKAGKVAYELTKGAAAASIAFNPQQERLSDLLVQFPVLNNPVTQYLASDDDDSRAEGRLKNALEGAGMDLIVMGVFAATMKVFKYGKRVAQGDVEAAGKLEEAEAELAKQVKIAQAQAGEHGGVVTVGGSESRILPPGTNVINQGLGQKVGAQDQQLADTMGQLTEGGGATLPKTEAVPSNPPTSGNLIDNALTQKQFDEAPNPKAGSKPVDPAAAPIDEIDQMVAETVKRTEPEAKPAAKGKKAPKAAPAEAPAPKAAPAQQAEVEVAKARITNLPKIETNGIGYKIVPEADMHTIGKAAGIDTSNWLAAANPKTGEIWISSKVLKETPERQREIIMHETGHTLEKHFIERVTGVKDGRLNSIPPQLKAEFEAASRMFRPEHWGKVDEAVAKNKSANATLAKAGAKGRVPLSRKAKDDAAYLASAPEQFADAFSIWKTRRADFERVAPQTAKLFDEHFMPWRDHDFGSHLDDLAALSEGVQGLKAARIAEPIMVPDEQVAVDLVRQANADDAALAQHGSKMAAEAAGHRFAKGSKLPYQKLSDPQSMKNFMDRVADEFEAELNRAKGGDVLTDARASRLANKMLDVFNDDPAVLMGKLQAAGSAATRMQAYMEAALAIAERTKQDLQQLVKNNDLGNYTEFGGDANLAEAAVPLRLAIHIEALAQAQAISSNAGRTLRRLRGDLRIKPELIEQVKKLSPEEAARIITMSGDDLSMSAKLLSQGWWNRWTRAAGSLYSNNLLWFWPTHVRNLLGNTWMLGTTPAMRAIGSFGLKEGGQDIRKAALREYRYMLSSISDAKDFAVQAYLKGDSILDPHGNEFFRDQAGIANAGMNSVSGNTLASAIGLKPMNTFGDFLGNTFKSIGFVFTQPNRVLGMSDEFMKQISYRASILSKASVEADSMVALGTLNKSDYGKFLKQKLEAAFDDQYRAINKDALYDAEVRTFSQPLLPNTIGRGVAGVVGANPVLRLVLPFVRTPVNLFRYAIKLTPVLQFAQREFKQMLKGELGPARQADAIGQMAMGGMLAFSALSLAGAGLITGGPPPGPNQQKSLTDLGWRPYSFRVENPDGSNTYIPFSQLDPPGMLLGMVADIHQIFTQGEMAEQGIDQLIIPLVLALTKNLTSKTYLQSVNDAIDAASGQDPAAMQQFIGGVASGLVPMSSALRGYNPDPLMRDARSILDRVMAGIPGLSKELPPRRDYAGVPVGRQVGMVFKDNADDLADAENQRMLESYGYGLTPLVATPRGDVNLRQYRLKNGQTAFDRYQELVYQPGGKGPNVKQVLADLIKSADYAKLPDGPGGTKGSKLWALQRVLDKYREAAYRQLIRENPDLAVATAASQQKVREYLRTGTGADPVSSAIKNANKAFGIQ